MLAILGDFGICSENKSFLSFLMTITGVKDHLPRGSAHHSTSLHISPLIRQALRSKTEGAEQLIMHVPICSQTVQMGQNSSLAVGDTKVKCFCPAYKSKQWQNLGRNQENWQGSFPSLSKEVLAS